MLTRRAALAAPLLLPALSPALAQPAGGTLRIALSASLNQLDPARATIGDEYLWCVIAFNGLTRMRPDMTVEPELAASWTFTDDLKTWTFRLRQGVKFHHGREMTSEDVAASFRRILDPATASPVRTNYAMISAIETPDPHSVVFRLAYPYGGFAEILADRQVKILPHDALAGMAQQPIGTGPFRFARYTPGDRLVATRNADYWEGAPPLAQVELRVMPEMAARLAALRAGDIDIVWDLNPEDVKPLRDNAALRVESIATASWDGAVMNNTIAPFNDVRVRRAFHLAVDKRDVVEVVLFGEGAPTHSPIPPSHPFFATDLPFTAANPSAARALLREAGHPNGLKVPLVIPVGRPVRERLGVTLQQLARPAGFEIEIQRVPFARYSAEVAGKAPLYIDGYFARPTVDTACHPFLHSGGSWNGRLWKYSNPQVDQALDAARLTGDAGQQKTHYLAMQRALAADPCGFFAYAVKFAVAYRAGVQGVATHPMRWFDLRQARLA